MTKPVFLLNGSNLNLLGRREPHIYGHTTLADIEAMSRKRAEALGLKLDFRQTNSEGTMVDWIHEALDGASGIVINPAGFSFHSIPVFDALKVFRWPIVELHISNIHRRDPEYHHSLISKVATTVIAGAGAFGYELALEAVAELLKQGEPKA